MILQNNLATNLIDLRKENGLTQEELGERIGVSNKTISKWENGIFVPDITCLTAIADFYNISVDDLLNGNRDQYNKKKRKSSCRMCNLILNLVVISLIMLSFNINIFLSRNIFASLIINSVILVPVSIICLYFIIRTHRRRKE